MGSLEAKGGGNVKFFLLLVSDSNHTLTNQQFVNCAYLEILSALAPALPVCLSVGKLTSTSNRLCAVSIPSVFSYSTCVHTRWLVIVMRLHFVWVQLQQRH